MPQSPPPTAGDRLPRWVIWLGSAAIAYHLFSVVIGVLAVPSGPWPSMMGPTLNMPPQLVLSLDESLARPYPKLVKTTHNYRFASDRAGTQEAAEPNLPLLDDAG